MIASYVDFEFGHCHCIRCSEKHPPKPIPVERAKRNTEHLSIAKSKIIKENKVMRRKREGRKG